ncbi:hypothetical protein B6N60_01111 [Richelia sinica FACHB-800]|uniref:Uncharacterized protein n=1 Tax=Richelia sinica FACHB-800 TaxID=1357546 RepID=A0A975T598_9NOST|nr:hypothetical protein [Richelia sinica]MBD2664335.1 hypothetical protein [Richelia sinica FACHB-800]QXE22428.1 hypothetical protein B6N60_01111 [Richelia sinica FACHB-800]
MINSAEFCKAWAKNNKLIVSLCTIILLGIIVYFLLAHHIITAIYSDKLPALDFLIKHKSQNPLDFYLRRADSFFIKGNIFIFLGILGISFLSKIFIKDKVNLITILGNEITKFKTLIIDNRKILSFLTLLSVGFFALYLALGLSLIPGYAYNKFTFFFADQGDWIKLEWSKYHKGSHALRLLILAPFSVLKLISPPVPKIVIAIIINAFCGAMSVFLASLCFWNISKKRIVTFLWTCLFGLSMTHLFFSTLVEARALGTASIIATYLLFIISWQHQKLYLGYWILAGLFSFGVTITNFSNTIICFSVLLFGLKNNNKITRILEYLGGIFLIAFFLSLVQKRFFGGKYFFVTETLDTELEWVKVTIFNHPLLVLSELFKHFFLVSVVSPSPFPEKIVPGTKIVLNFFDQPMLYSVVGLIAVILWILFLVIGLYKNFRDINQEGNLYFLGATLLATVFNICFYSVFDTPEMFIFTSYFSFPFLLLILNTSIMKQRYYMLGTILLIVLLGINNLHIMQQIIYLART